LCLQVGGFLKFPTEITYAILVYPMLATCPAHRTALLFTVLTILGDLVWYSGIAVVPTLV